MSHPDQSYRADFAVIADLVPNGVRLLDVGCGDGALLELLQRKRQVRGRGLELSQAGVNACVARGLSVLQGDADRDLEFYPDDGFDWVVLSQTIQATRAPDQVLRQMLRLAPRAIVSLPNFGHWQVIWSLISRGRMPITPDLPSSWYNTSNIHMCTLLDFEDLAQAVGARITRCVALRSGHPAKPVARLDGFTNITAAGAVFVIERAAQP